MTLAEAIGLDALSMPKLAEHLGIGVTSIYWYFRNKNDLIEALTVVAAQRFHDVMWVPPDIAWDERLFGSFLRLRAAMRADTVCCDLIFMRGGRASEAALTHMWQDTEISIARMIESGFTPHDALQNIVILSLYTRGSVVLERQMLRDGIEPDAPTPVPDRFALFASTLKNQNTRGVSERAYADQLRLIIDGMALRLQRRKKS